MRPLPDAEDSLSQTPPSLLLPLQQLLNRLIVNDPVTHQRLRALDGRAVMVRLEPPGIGLVLSWTDGQMQVQVDPEGPADLALRASPGVLLAQLLRALSGQAPQAHGMQLAGDAELARVLAEVARHYRPDPGALLRPLFGEVIGQSLAEGLAGAAKLARRSLQRLAENGSDYLREESRVLISHSEQSELIDAIETLRDDVERAELRLQRLRQRLGQRMDQRR